MPIWMIIIAGPVSVPPSAKLNITCRISRQIATKTMKKADQLSIFDLLPSKKALKKDRPPYLTTALAAWPTPRAAFFMSETSAMFYTHLFISGFEFSLGISNSHKLFGIGGDNLIFCVRGDHSQGHVLKTGEEDALAHRRFK